MTAPVEVDLGEAKALLTLAVRLAEMIHEHQGECEAWFQVNAAIWTLRDVVREVGKAT